MMNTMNTPMGYNDQGYPFNMALATLQRIHYLLMDYSRISTIAMIGIKTEQELAQNLELKRRIAWQIYLQSVFLLENYQQPPLIKQFESIPISRSPTGDRTYSSREEVELDRFMINLLDALQQNKIFMPGKNDPRQALRRA